MSRPPRPVAVILSLLVLLASACGSESTGSDATDQASADESTTSTITSTQPNGSTTTTAPPTVDDTGTEGGTEAEAEAETDGPEPAADLVIEGSFLDGEILIEDRRFEVERGSSVLITFESDQAEHIHLHGYDILVDVVPGQPAELAFVADSPGSFEVELEDSRRFLFELLVR